MCNLLSLKDFYNHSSRVISRVEELQQTKQNWQLAENEQTKQQSE